MLAALKDSPEAFSTTYESASRRSHESWVEQADVAAEGPDRAIFLAAESEQLLSSEVVYQGKRIESGTYSASPLLADGKIYCVDEEGTATVVKAGPEFEILAVNKLDNLTLASPVAVDNQIFIRTADYLYCIQKK